MLKLIGIVMLAALGLIALIAALFQLFDGGDVEGKLMLVLPFSEHDENIEMLLRNACRLCSNSSADIEIIAVYCGFQDTDGGACEAYEICKSFARDYGIVKCTTYDKMSDIISREIKR